MASSSATESASARSVVVSNVAGAVTPDIVTQFFSNIGPVIGTKTLNYYPAADARQFLVVFETAAQAATALSLSGVKLLDKQILVTAGEIPPPSVSPMSSSSSSLSSVVSAVPQISPSLLPLPIPVQLPIPQSQPPQSMSPVRAAAIMVAKSNGDPEAVSHTQKAEEVTRTVYVGNINASVSSDQLTLFFAGAGAVNFCRMAGDETHPSRFAFLEFTTLAGANAALALNGAILVDRPLRVSKSKNPIVRPSVSAFEARRQQKEQMKVLAIVDQLNKKLSETPTPQPGTATATAVTTSEKKDGPSRDKRKSRSRSRERSHRKRSRSRSRHHHSHSHRHDHGHGRRHSRSRSRSSSSSRSRSRSRGHGHKSSHHHRSRSKHTPAAAAAPATEKPKTQPPPTETPAVSTAATTTQEQPQQVQAPQSQVAMAMKESN